MNREHNFIHNTSKSQYKVKLIIQQSLQIYLEEKYSLISWRGQFTQEHIKDITFKTGQELYFKQFVDLLMKALSERDLSCYVDILSSQDLENMKNKKQGQNYKPKEPTKSNKRYLILTYMINQSKYHYPLSLAQIDLNLGVEELTLVYNQLRIDLEAARTAALNETSKTDNSFSINYEKKNGKGNNPNRIKQVDQLKSQNQILKGKLARLQQQAEKKKANIQIQAAIERTKLLKQSLQTANLQLVDWKNNIQEQQQTLADLKKQMTKLHKRICGLLVSEKQMVAKKKGQEVEKQLGQIKNIMKKNTQEIDKLKKQLQNSKNKVKQLEIKAKKLTSEKDVIRKGRKGPYSSAGSVRSYGSYSSKKSYGGVSTSSKGKSNYSYNSYKY